ncbi:MAG: Alanine--tRNA ligase [Alphaproteobacteria bacterium MarineAlpha9_Bin3]|nr:MAG: Alanine--tRNA ligase [Alphaproteobacteria bacterium MarineAlpha9_Bin3]
MTNSTNEIRRAFLDYFTSNGHHELSSSPLIPQDDPTLLFTNAGMVQFKNIFTGKENSKFNRATTSQKCLRAGGKHNDLENVGYTARHHTFFEMLGNFSFGDYFKDLAIEYAWNLVTKIYGLDPKKLLVTVYSEDEEANNLWKKISGLPESRIIKIATSDNFWSMGDTGPCGPCSEIFYDHGPKIDGGVPGSENEDGDRFIEIWNLVFMQYEMLSNGNRNNLPKPSIDTGMGLERMAAVLQGVHNNYEIDLFQELINTSIEYSGVEANDESLISHRVISDHLRASAFLIADGVLPSNEGRGYVLRRIMRRAMRHVHKLGIKDPHMFRLVNSLSNQMGESFTELNRAKLLIETTLKDEEIKFRETLERGLGLLDQSINKLNNSEKLPGEVAFKLYDTYGFPIDLTADILRGKGRDLDYKGFEESMNLQKETARQAWSGTGDQEADSTWIDIKEREGNVKFLGYEITQTNSKVTSIVINNKEKNEVKVGEEAKVITRESTFYGESGGQLGDTGKIKWKNGEAIVLDTKKFETLIVHIIKVVKGVLKINDDVSLSIDIDRRNSLKVHHSATHLLHEALRRNLGEHITQKGSLVAPDKLRFDISHNKPISNKEVGIIEKEINSKIRENFEVFTEIMSIDEAQKIGALALFGEKYGDEVRVVKMQNNDNDKYSIELCGGTHVNRTGDIGLFKIISESALGAGIRRIEAVAGQAAIEVFQNYNNVISEISSEMRVSSEILKERVSSLISDKKALEKKLVDLNKKINTSNISDVKTNNDVINNIKVISKVLDSMPPKELKGLVDEIKKDIVSGIVIIISTFDKKASLVVGVTEDITNKYDAVEFTKAAVELLGGKGGGGRPDMAQGGGPKYQKTEDAINQIKKIIKSK